jgi:hypothetical protein
MIPKSSQGQMPPEMIQAMAKMQNDKMSAEARVMDSQTRAKETDAKIQLDMLRLQMEQDAQNPQTDPTKMAEIQIQQMDIQQRAEDAMIDAINRKRDRESRERLAAVKLAEELIRNPQGLGVVGNVLDQGMIDRLESNEPTLDGRQTGEL